MTTTTITVPAAFQALVPQEGPKAVNAFGGSGTSGFAKLRYRGKIWAIDYKGQETQLKRDDGDGYRNSVDVVIVKVSQFKSKEFYLKEWGGKEAAGMPDCFSSNSLRPDPAVKPETKQKETCGTCPHNVWGT